MFGWPFLLVKSGGLIADESELAAADDGLRRVDDATALDEVIAEDGGVAAVVVEGDGLGAAGDGVVVDEPVQARGEVDEKVDDWSV